MISLHKLLDLTNKEIFIIDGKQIKDVVVEYIAQWDERYYMVRFYSIRYFDYKTQKSGSISRPAQKLDELSQLLFETKAEAEKYLLENKNVKN